MSNFVTPKAFMIAETNTRAAGMEAALAELGVHGWDNNAETHADLLTEFAGKSCYMSFDLELNNNLTKVGGRSNHDYIQKGIVATKHGSVLEHSTVSFMLTNVSRVVTHELVRHRAGTAFSQTSGRYVRTDQIDMYAPTLIAQNPEAAAVFKRAMTQMEENLKELEGIFEVDKQDFNTKKQLTSAFRRIIGNGQANHIVVTANHRAWRHMIEMRTSVHAEEEIRVIFADIGRQLFQKFPTIYADAVFDISSGIPEITFTHSKV